MARDATNRLGQQAAAARQTGNGGQPGTAVAERPRTALQQKQDTLAGMLKRMGPEMAAALPKHMTPDRLVRISTTVMRRTPALATCSPESFLGAVMTCAQLGLEPGPTGQAYLVPYGSEVTFILGYRGMLELARRSGQVETVYAHPVFKADKFTYALGLNEALEHVPSMDDEPDTADNPLTHVYAVVKYKGGGHNVAVMTRAQVERIRLASKSKNSGAWKDHYTEMACKTVLRRLAKWMPQSVEFQTAMGAEEKVRTNWQNPASLDDVAADPYPDAIDSTVVEDDAVRPTSGAPVDARTGELPDGPLGDDQDVLPVEEPDQGWPPVADIPGGE